MRPRAVGATIVVLSVATLVIAAGLSVVGRASPAIQVIPFVLGIPGLFLGWVTYRNDGSGKSKLTEVADELAERVGHQWEIETQVRQFNEAGTLSVSWVPADTELVEALPSLARQAMDSPGSQGMDPGWATRPGQLSGSGLELTKVLGRVPTGRLVVLGEPGSGKTVLLLRLLQDLLSHRHPGTAVPVLMPLASWNPAAQSLKSWLISRLVLDYPRLKGPSRSSEPRCNLAEALIDAHLLLIMLDGLDEIPDEVRSSAISEINKFLVPGVRIILSCRTAEYGKALESSGAPGLRVKLRGAAGISLRALDNSTIKGYFLGGEGDRSAEAQWWDPVLRTLTTSLPVAEALRTPLLAGLARSVYDPRLSENEGSGSPDLPADLCAFPTLEAIRLHLFSRFIHRAYRRQAGQKKNRWETVQSERWLAFLAHHLVTKLDGKNEIAWWELRYAGSGPLVPAVVGAICGLAAGLAAGFGRHVGAGIGIGLGAGAFAGLTPGILIRRASKNKGRPSVGIAGALIGSIAGGLLGGLAGKMGIGHAVWPFGGLAVALAIGIGVGSSTNFLGGVAGGLVGGFVAAVLESFGKGLPAGLLNGAGMGLAAALAARYVGRLTPSYRLKWSPFGALCGVAIGTAVGLIAGRADGLQVGLVGGAAVGVFSALPCGLIGRNPEQKKEQQESAALGPRESLRRDHRTFWKTAPAAGIAAAIAGVLGGGLASVLAVKAHPDLRNVLSDGLGIGVAAGIIIGLGFGLHHAASGFFAITRLWLASRRKIPWRLMSFLHDAHRQRGILRQSGTVYQFRHKEIMLWLSDSYQAHTTRSQEPDLGPAPLGESLASSAYER